MPELRWTLLILGLAFLAALVGWEWRRKRRLPADPFPPRAADSVPVYREPTLTLPEMRAREPVAAPQLPVVEVGEVMTASRHEGLRIEEEMSAVDVPGGAGGEAPREPNLDLLSQPLSDSSLDPVPQTESVSDASTSAEFVSGPCVSASEARVLPQPELPPEPIVDWPPEAERKLLALRLIAQPGERFAGRGLRLALVAEGFVHGKFSIFHKPGPDGRVTVSVASLSQPGSFDLESMDTYRYGGVGLFIVLPGPLAPGEQFDELLSVARDLRDRLSGILQDERGQPLSAERIKALRESVTEEPMSPRLSEPPSAAPPAADPHP